MVDTRGPGKIVLVSKFCSKVLVHDPKILVKTFTASMCGNFGGPAGGSAPGKVLRPKYKISDRRSQDTSDS